MPKIIMLDSKDYSNKDSNYGDCIIIDNKKELFIYDCGSQEHAEKVIEYMDLNNYKKAIVVLSHNDSDHFNGIPHLLENERVSSIYTLLLFKHTDEILKRIGDKRKTPKSLIDGIKKYYDNIYSLNGASELLKDSLSNIKKSIGTGITINGPSFEYTLDAVAKALDKREGDTINKETITNAVSTQLSIEIEDTKFFLCGDSCFKAIEDEIINYNCIQLPHHGKLEQAERIFETNSKKNNNIYFVSDNTGNSNGGSDNLIGKKGYNIKNTKLDGKIIYSLKREQPLKKFLG